jgi:Ca-activated chloride channel family protein
MVALDVSSSMLAEDADPSRLQQARSTVDTLLDRLTGTDVGLVLFSSAAFVQTPLTVDLETVRNLAHQAGPASISRRGTALEKAIDVAASAFPERLAARRVILLLTDGEDHEGDPIAASAGARSQGITVHAIGFGSREGGPIPLRDKEGYLLGYKRDIQGNPVTSRLNERLLQQIVEQTGGRYARATSGRSAVDVIMAAMGPPQALTGETRLLTVPIDRYGWFVALALLALVFDMLISEHAGSRVLT